MNPIYLILIFVVATLVGYFIIKNVPSLLHTPLMSGMNALSGVTILGAIAAVGIAVISKGQDTLMANIIGGIAVIAATINVVGGFAVTNRMLKMFNRKKEKSNV